MKELVPEVYRPTYPNVYNDDYKPENNKIYIENLFRGAKLGNYGQILVGMPTIIAGLINRKSRGQAQNYDNDDEKKNAEEEKKA